MRHTVCWLPLLLSSQLYSHCVSQCKAGSFKPCRLWVWLSAEGSIRRQVFKLVEFRSILVVKQCRRVIVARILFIWLFWSVFANESFSNHLCGTYFMILYLILHLIVKDTCLIWGKNIAVYPKRYIKTLYVKES